MENLLLSDKPAYPAGVHPVVKASLAVSDRNNLAIFFCSSYFRSLKLTILKCEYCNNMFSWIVVFKKDFCEAIDL